MNNASSRPKAPRKIFTARTLPQALVFFARARKKRLVSRALQRTIVESASMDLQPGQILDNKYRIVRLVGEGGMGAVFEGENTRIMRRVAIKVLNHAASADSNTVMRFER